MYNYHNTRIYVPPSTSTVERTFSDMKLKYVRMGEDTLDQTLRLCIEGSPIYQMKISIQFEELETAETKTISNLNVFEG